MALFQKAVVQKDRNSDYNETLLLNTKKVVDFHPDTDGNVIFYYAEMGDLKRQAIEYHVDENFDTFIGDLRSAEDKEQDTGYNIISLTAEEAGIGGRTFAKRIGFHKDNLIKGIEDKDNSNKSHIWLAYGDFKPVRYKVDATLTEIEAEASASESV